MSKAVVGERGDGRAIQETVAPTAAAAAAVCVTTLETLKEQL